MGLSDRAFPHHIRLLTSLKKIQIYLTNKNLITLILYSRYVNKRQKGSNFGTFLWLSASNNDIKCYKAGSKFYQTVFNTILKRTQKSICLVSHLLKIVPERPGLYTYTDKNPSDFGPLLAALRSNGLLQCTDVRSVAPFIYCLA